jgi:hypothetical protein
MAVLCATGRADQPRTSDETRALLDFAAHLVVKGIPAVLAVPTRMSDRSGVMFWKAFYGALADGLPLDEALKAARNALLQRREPAPYWCLPALFTGPDDRALAPYTGTSSASDVKRLGVVTMTGSAAKPAPPAEPAYAGSAEEAARDSWVSGIVPGLIATGLIMALLNIANPPYAYHNIWRGVVQNLLSTLAALFPYLLYSFFISARRLILKRDFELNLQRLGLNSADESFVQRFNAVFGADDRLGQFARAPLILLTMLLLIGWFLVYYPPVADETPLLWPNLNPLALGFLGAYFITLMVLYQRYVTNDLKPPLFVSIAVRVLMVLILDSVLFLAAGQPPGASANLDATAWPVLVAAFVIGIFPAAGVRAHADRHRSRWPNTRASTNRCRSAGWTASTSCPNCACMTRASTTSRTWPPLTSSSCSCKRAIRRNASSIGSTRRCCRCMSSTKRWSRPIAAWACARPATWQLPAPGKTSCSTTAARLGQPTRPGATRR